MNFCLTSTLGLARQLTGRSFKDLLQVDYLLLRFGFKPGGTTASTPVLSGHLREGLKKHGRISMLATMGYITPEITGKFPGYLSPSAGLKFADVPNGLAAISKVPAAGWGQILA